jgi:excisionase family DNA binding protein
MNQVRQPRPLASEPSQGRFDSPYLTAKEAAAYLRFANVRALYKAIRPQGIPVRYRGKTLLFHRDQLDRWLAGESLSELRRVR